MRQFYKNWLQPLLIIALIGAFFNGNVAAQTTGVKISGTVKDATGLPLPGVSISLKGSDQGTVSNPNGQFNLTVPGMGSVLVFSSIGYVSQEQTVGAATTLSVTLLDDPKSLNEVVVVGYGTQKRRDITGSVTTVNPQRLNDLPNNNLANALEGAVPGLTVTQAGGGAEGTASIQIRGQRSITAANNPLIILDGIPYNGSLTDINPGDIGNIEVLKDASAAAIYGSRGANGVLLVSTKKGTNNKPVVSYDGSYGVDKYTRIPAVLTPQQFYAYKTVRNPGSITPSETAIFNAGTFTDWVGLTTQNGQRDQQAVSVRGGSDNSKYYVSLNYLGDDGIAVNDRFRRISSTINLELNITKWLTYGTSTILGFNNRSGMPATLSGDYSAFTFNPLTTPFFSDGKTPTIYPWPETVYYANPLAPTLVDNSDLQYQVYSTNYLEVKLPLKGLTYRINTGVTHVSRDQNSYYGRNTKTGLEAQGQINEASNVSNSYTIENILNFDRDFGKHHVGFTGLYSYENDIVSNHNLKSTGFPNDVLTYYQASVALLTTADVNSTSTPLYSKATLLSQMARVNYSYDGRYLLTATVRRDGSSDFGVNDKYGVFPSVALGWNISNEQFMKDVTVIDNLKLRASYGSNGEQAVPAYSTFAKLSNATYLNGTTTAPGYIPQTLANPDLHWETSNTLNVGLDFGVLKGRITGTIDVYQTKTHDLLLNRSIPSTNGISNILQNIGKTQNNGIDLGVSSVNVKTKDFTWTSNASFSLNRNKIVDLYGNAKSDTANAWFIGKPINGNFGYKYLGVWQLTDDLTRSPQPNTQAGYAKVADLNGDGKITGSDRTLLGSLQPQFTYGLANTFKYKNLSLYAFLQGVQGVTKRNTTLSDNVATAVERNTYAKNYWTPTNPTNDYYANAQLLATPIYQPNVYGVGIYQNASYMRVKDLMLSYDLAPGLLQKIKVSRVRLFIEGRNLFTITPWKGFDPELDADNTSIPLLVKEYVVGLNVSL